MKWNLPMVKVEFRREIVSILKDRQMWSRKNDELRKFLIHWKGMLKNEASWRRVLPCGSLKTRSKSFCSLSR